MKFRKFLVTAGLLLMTIPTVFSQKVGIKTNLLYDAALTPTLGVEVGLAPKWSLDLSGSLNAWNPIKDSEGKYRKWKLWMFQPEARYWFCQRFSGHFLGFHALGGQYNIGNLNLPDFLGTHFSILKDNYLQGWYAGAGIAYGYSWILSRHWNLEAEIGIGWVYTRYDRYQCEGCRKKVDSKHPHNYYGPTKAALNIIYVF